jgi:crossover junction endodeoxyribonuclease RuvC
MILLGIDPGLRVTGYGVLSAEGPKVRVVEAGVVRSTDGRPLEKRLFELFTGVSEVLAEFKPHSIGVEQLYSSYRHPRTAILMGHARGAVFLAAAVAGIPVVGYTPARIKKNLTGNGRAEKAQMQRAVQAALNLPELPKPPDVADALAAALCHLHTMRRG